MATLRISVGSFGLAMLASLGFGCGGSVEIDGQGQGGSAGAGGGQGGFPGSGGSGGAAGQPSLPVCTVFSQNSGFETCVEGWTRRVNVQNCASALPRSGFVCPTPSTVDTCAGDTDCTTSPNGYCMGGVQYSGCFCNYGCLTDSDCGGGQVCLCQDPVGQCVPAGCHSDAECGNGYCITYDYNPGCGGVAFACVTPQDECQSGAQCSTGYCGLAPDGHRICTYAGCVIGRPFLVKGEDRLAPIVQRDDWLKTHRGIFDEVGSSDQRQRLAGYYAQVGQMEHAAVAAFARLAMQLISFGAPSELVELAIQAQRDEVGHARLAFGLASELAGTPVGPGALSIDGSLDNVSLEHVAHTTVVEGCVGETIAALEAAELKERAVNSELGNVFEQIAGDEAMHAQLAWRVVAWLLEVGGTPVRAAVHRGFHDALLRPRIARRAAPEDSPYGALDDELAGEVRNQVLNEIIAPVANSLGIEILEFNRAA